MQIKKTGCHFEIDSLFRAKVTLTKLYHHKNVMLLL